MSRRFWRWAAGAIVSVFLACGGATFWLLATEGGARLLVARVTPLLPAALQVAEVDGTLLNGLQFRSVSWSDRTVKVSVDQLDTRIELLPLMRRQVRIESLDVRNVDVLVSQRPPSDSDSAPFSLDLPFTLRVETALVSNAHVSTGGGDLVIQKLELSGQLSGPVLQVDRLEIQSELADISLSGDARLAGTYPITAVASWKLRLPDRPRLSGEIRLHGDISSYEIEHELNTPYEILTQGTFAVIGDGVVVDLLNTWREVGIDTGDGRTVNLADGVLRIAGAPAEFSFDGSTTVSTGDIPPLIVTTKGKRDADHINIESVSASNAWGQLLASGDALVAPEFSLKIVAEMSGSIPVLSGDRNAYPVNASGALSYADDQLQVENAVVRVGDNRIDVDGSYGPNLQGTATLTLSDLTQLGVDVAGALSGDIRFVSDLETFDASGKLNGESLEWRDYYVDRLSADFDVPATGRGNLMLKIADARIGSLLFSTGQLAAVGSAESHKVQAVIVGEQARGELEFYGGFADETWSGALERLAVNGERLGEWTLRENSDFSLSRSRVNVATTCLDSISNSGVACGALDYEFSGPLRFDASVSELPLTAFAANLPEGAEVEGAIEAHASGEFLDQRLTASASLNVHDLALKATFEGDEVSATFNQAFANVSIVDNRLTSEFAFTLSNDVDHLKSKIQIADIFDQQSPLGGNGSLELNDLGVFSFFYPDLANPVGRIVGTVDIGGSLEAPEIIGEIGLKDGSVGIGRAGIVITDVGLSLRQARAGRLTIQGGARSGDGYLKMDGETTVSSHSGIRTELNLNGKNFTLVQLPDWRVTASPDIAVLFDDRETRVSGELGIPTANVSIHDLPESAERPSPDAVVHRSDEPVRTKRRVTYVDVRTTLGEDVFLSGFGLTTGLEGSVRIVGSSNTPYVSSGRVVLRDGRYQAYGQNLTIESGELMFNGPLTDPTLNIRATRTASDKTVAGIHLTGTPAQLRSEVYSEPALGDAETLSYLLTGRPLINADSEEGDMLNQAAFALGLTTAGSVASRIRNELGFETLGVQGGSESRQFVAGKRFGDRLLVEYAYGIVDNLGTLLLRYQLSSRLILESRSGSVRNLDIVYSVKKR